MRIKIIWLMLALVLLMSSISPADDAPTYSVTGADGLTYKTSEDGTIRISNNRGAVGYIGFAITGNIDGVNQTYINDQFTWSWSRSYYNITEQEYNVTTEEWYNVTKAVNVYRAYNNVPYFNITAVYSNLPQGDIKIRHVITNNLRYNITNVKFWYIHTFSSQKAITYNKERYNITNTSILHIQGNFSNVKSLLNFFDYGFYYQDLIDSGFKVTDVILGKATRFGYPNRIVAAIGVTKSNGIFPDRSRVTLDPFTTGYIYPEAWGDPLNEWTNAQNVVSDNNQYMTSAILYKLEDTDYYNFDIPDNAMITGIQVQIGAKYT